MRVTIDQDEIRKFSETKTLYPCLLTRSDLLELEKLITDNLTLIDYVRNPGPISKIKVFVDTPHANYTFNSLQEINEDLYILKITSLRIYSNNTNEEMLISFDNYFQKIDFTCTDQIKTIGFIEQLGSFLKSKSLWYWPMLSRPYSLILSSLISIILLIILTFLFYEIADIVFSKIITQTKIYLSFTLSFILNLFVSVNEIVTRIFPIIRIQKTKQKNHFNFLTTDEFKKDIAIIIITALITYLTTSFNNPNNCNVETPKTTIKKELVRKTP